MSGMTKKQREEMLKMTAMALENRALLTALLDGMGEKEGDRITCLAGQVLKQMST